jgi:dynein heavy chain
MAKTIDVWLKVQNLWLYLEPVFASADIKKQLPNEAVRFKEVDTSWRRTIDQVQRDNAANSV